MKHKESKPPTEDQLRRLALQATKGAKAVHQREYTTLIGTLQDSAFLPLMKEGFATVTQDAQKNRRTWRLTDEGLLFVWYGKRYEK